MVGKEVGVDVGGRFVGAEVGIAVGVSDGFALGFSLDISDGLDLGLSVPYGLLGSLGSWRLMERVPPTSTVLHRSPSASKANHPPVGSSRSLVFVVTNIGIGYLYACPHINHHRFLGFC